MRIARKSLLLVLCFTAVLALTACQMVPRIGSTTTTLATEQMLLQTPMPASDPRDLALRLRPDVAEVPLVVNSSTPDYGVGDHLTFWVSNVSTQATEQITAELILKTAVAYGWAEVGPSYNRAALIQAVEQFSAHSYPEMVAFFGSEWQPGVDNDPRLHILFTTGMGGPAGYFGHADEYSRIVNPYSNEKEMFYVSLDDLSRTGMLDALLAHEFQHMIHWYHDSNEATWIDEGLSEYAQEVAGLGIAAAFVGDFLSQPDTPLTAWQDGTQNHYGASYLFVKYLHQRFGPDLLRTVVAQPADGVAGLQQAFALHGITQEFDALFADWVVANYANQPDALGQEGLYGYDEVHFGKPRTTLLDATRQATVNNYATDYFRVQGEGDVTIHFTGQTTTHLGTPSPYSGHYAWWSNQGDRSDSQLTRRFDLRSVEPSEPLELEVTMWWDIEEYYDFGYVLASRDGRKWEILPSRQTTTDNPTGHSFGPAYTGKPMASDSTAGWVAERFDLSPYAGEQIWIRFEYVTDDAIHHTGWIIDDIRLAAINYATDFEHGADGWESQGWLLTPGNLIQRWLLQVMEFEGDALAALRRLRVDAEGRAQVEIANLHDGKEVILAISALAPATTAPAPYELEIRPQEVE
jgi:immune inhibitor A